jgi:hypothetical protein
MSDHQLDHGDGWFGQTMLCRGVGDDLVQHTLVPGTDDHMTATRNDITASKSLHKSPSPPHRRHK